MGRAWAGIDAGKEVHWVHTLDASGEKLLSQKVENSEADLSSLIDEALYLADEFIWAIDQPAWSVCLLACLETTLGVLALRLASQAAARASRNSVGSGLG